MVADPEEAEAAEVTIAFIAKTLNMYGTTKVKPVTVKLVAADKVFALAVVQVEPLLEEYSTLYPAIAEPPSDPGALQVKLADVTPAVTEAATPLGAPGATELVAVNDMVWFPSAIAGTHVSTVPKSETVGTPIVLPETVAASAVALTPPYSTIYVSDSAGEICFKSLHSPSASI